MTGATENYSQRGIIPRTIQHLFKEIQNRPDRSYTVRIGYLEIYNEQLIDLLSTMPLQNSTEFNSGLSIYDDRGDVFVKGLTYQLAATEEEALNLLFEVCLCVLYLFFIYRKILTKQRTFVYLCRNIGSFKSYCVFHAIFLYKIGDKYVA